MRDVWKPTVADAGTEATPQEFRASWETHLIAAGANTDHVCDRRALDQHDCALAGRGRA